MSNKYSYKTLYDWCLQNNREDLLDDWDDKKNILTPKSISYGSNKKVWWKCPKGHPSYEAVPSKRRIGHGCPICSNHKIVENINSLQKLQPKLMKEWLWEENNKIGIYPNKISVKSSANVWWKCSKCGNVWKTIVNNRTDKNSGCPYCANLKLKEGFNDLQTKNPKLADEWNYEKNGNLTPNKIVEYSTKKVWWKCKKCGGEWISSPNQRHKSNCPYCGHHKLRTPKDSVAFLYPNLVKEWDYDKNSKISPLNCSKSSDKIVWWKCNKGHSWKTAVKTRTKGNGCPYCSNKKVLEGFNDLFTTNPELIKEWDYEKNSIDPNKIVFGSEKKAFWICSKCGNKWEAVIYSRINGRGCPKCGRDEANLNRLKTYADRNSFVENYPDLVKEIDFDKTNIDLSIISSSSNRKIWWKCNKGHSWKTSIVSRTNNKSNCPYCNNQKILKGFNDLATKNPQLAKEWDYTKNSSLTPFDVAPHGKQSVWWKCEICGNSWKSTINNRANGRGCPNCSQSGTSFIEQALYYYVKQIYSDAKNRYKYNNKTELDIYVPSIKTAIEYDGSYYHSLKNSELRDNKKDLFCKENGIKLIRLREKPLKHTENALNISTDCRDWNHIETTIKMLLSLLDNNAKINVSLKKDIANIITSKKKLLKEKAFGIEYPKVLKEWNYEKNIPLLPDYFSKGSNTKIWWKCNKGHSWKTTISSRCKDKGSNCPYCNPKTHDRMIMCVETKEVFKNAIVAAEKYNCSPNTIRSACLGRCKTAKGLRWKYVK